MTSENQMTQKEQESGAVFSGKAIAVLVAEDHKEQIRLFCDLAKSLKGEFSFFLCVFSETPESFIEEWQNRIPKCMTVHLVKLAPRVRLRSLIELGKNLKQCDVKLIQAVGSKMIFPAHFMSKRFGFDWILSLSLGEEHFNLFNKMMVPSARQVEVELAKMLSSLPESLQGKAKAIFPALPRIRSTLAPEDINDKKCEVTAFVDHKDPHQIKTVLSAFDLARVQHPGWQLTIISDVPVQNDFTNLVSRLKIANCTKWQVGDESWKRALLKSDVILVPGLKRGLVQKVAQAMAQGVALVSLADLENEPGFADEKTFRSFRPKNVTELALVLKQLGEQPDKRLQLARSGMALFNQQFSFKHLEQKKRQLYRMM
ncbi:MAG: glycosyltransferase [Deltaproteobacteria bacterium]|nr:glycosyltransferase [Deltaproteobacteria bacterium]